MQQIQYKNINCFTQTIKKKKQVESIKHQMLKSPYLNNPVIAPAVTQTNFFSKRQDSQDNGNIKLESLLRIASQERRKLKDKTRHFKISDNIPNQPSAFFENRRASFLTEKSNQSPSKNAVKPKNQNLKVSSWEFTTNMMSQSQSRIASSPPNCTSTLFPTNVQSPVDQPILKKSSSPSTKNK